MNTATPTNLYEASHQWASRPDDQRFLTLEDLLKAVQSRREQSWTISPKGFEVNVVATSEEDEDALGVEVWTPMAEKKLLSPSNWAFGQLASVAKAPAGYLRKLPAMLAAINMQYGLEHLDSKREANLFLAQSNGDDMLRAVTSVSYGRIWDEEVVRAVINMNQSGIWTVPSASYSDADPKRATTLYGSDRDVFIFMVDAVNEIQVGTARLHRGFFAWNSEVGNATFGLKTFLYDFVCDNRIVWNARNVREIKIKHTGGAPDRFYSEGERHLKEFAGASPKQIVEVVARAQEMEIPKAKDETVDQWLVRKGYTKDEAKMSVNAAEQENGGARTVWQIVAGVTAFARSIKHTDARVALEKKAGDLLALAE